MAEPTRPVLRDLEPERSHPPRYFPTSWEALTLLHVGVLVVGVSWWFGGQSPGARQALLAWGSLGIILFFTAWGRLREAGGDPWQPLHHLWPLAVFDLIVGIGCLNPSTATSLHQGEEMLAYITPRWPWLPSSALPALSFRELWQFNGIVLSCYNVLLVLQRRRTLRRLLALMALNALALAVFGTFQKLTRADGLFFGLVDSPQSYFFSSFVYHNHWGAFTLLSLAVCLGLLFHQLRRSGHRDFWHSPAFMGGVAVVFLAATAPLSGSRSSTLLCALFILGATGHYLATVVRHRRERHESSTALIVVVVATLALAAAAIAFLSRETMGRRLQDTIGQFGQLQTEDSANSRLRLYRDTWAMAQARPLFGWGLETYGHVFMIYNSAPDPGVGSWKPYYEEAHNDWLQALAEVGFAGTALLLALGLAPWRGVRRAHLASSIPRYLAIGCALVLLYAWVEFPFANPAVMVAFWISLYTAARYAALGEHE